MSSTCINAPTAEAIPTGTNDFTLNSNKISSTTSSTAEIGVPNVAAMPAAAPDASSNLLSDPVTLTSCPINDPKAPPVWMIGPSAPNGCPEPIVNEAESAFNIPTFG